MATAIINYKGERFAIKHISTQEKKSILRLGTTKQYQKLLSLVINKHLSVNQFTGRVNELQEIISKIKEAI